MSSPMGHVKQLQQIRKPLITGVKTSDTGMSFFSVCQRTQTTLYKLNRLSSVQEMPGACPRVSVAATDSLVQSGAVPVQVPLAVQCLVISPEVR